MSLFCWKTLIIFGLLTENVQTPHLGIQSLFKSQLTFCTLCFHITFITAQLDFHCFLKTPLSQPPLFSHSISALNAFFLALLKSHHPLHPILEDPLQMLRIFTSLSWTGHFIVISSFSGLLPFFLIMLFFWPLLPCFAF